jgi:DNA-binding NarL/FixJ family response regulator
MKKTVFILDDHPLVADGFAKIINSTDHFIVSKCSAYPTDLFEYLSKNKVDLVILDINLGKNNNGLTLVPKLKKLNPVIKILILTMHKEYVFVKKAKDYLVDGYLTKDISSEELITSLEKIFSGSSIFPEGDNNLQDNMFLDSHGLLKNLTNKELDVLKFILDGCSVESISESMFLSPKTIANYQTSIRQKLDVKNNVQLMNKLNSLNINSRNFSYLN